MRAFVFGLAIGLFSLPAMAQRVHDLNPSSQLQYAEYGALSSRYAHGVLGDALEPTELSGLWHVQGGEPIELHLALDQTHVFEDLTPRLVDLDGDGTSEIITIRSHRNQGAQIAIYAPDPEVESFRLIASTPYIGRRNRWLAPVGAFDLDGDGHIEIAYVDRPHLARTLRIWRFDNGELTQIASREGLTNHRIGEAFISGGIRHCAGAPEMITADASWSRIIASTFANGQIQSRDIGPFSRANLAAAMNCAN